MVMVQLDNSQIARVLCYCDVQSICSMMRTCSKWYQILEEESTWRFLSLQRWDDISSLEKIKAAENGWKAHFVNRYLLDLKRVRKEGIAIRSLEMHSSGITCATICECIPKKSQNMKAKKVLITGSQNGELAQWDCQTKLCMKFLKEGKISNSKILECKSIGNNTIILCSSGDSTAGVGASVIWYDQWNGVIESQLKLDLVDSSWKQYELEELPGEISHFVEFGFEYIVASCKKHLIIWKRNANGENIPQTHSLHHFIPDAHDYDITQMEKIVGLIGEKDAAKDGIVNKRCIITGSYDGKLKIWDIISGSCLQIVDAHGGSVTFLSIAEDMPLIVSGSNDCTVKIWNLNHLNSPKEPMQTLNKCHQKEICCIRVSPSGNRIITGSRDCTLKVWDFKSTKQCYELSYTWTRYIPMCIDFDSTIIVVGYSNGIVDVFGSKTGTLLYNFDNLHMGPVKNVIIDKEHKFFVCTSSDCGISFLDCTLKREWTNQNVKEGDNFVEKSFIYDATTQTYLEPPTKTWPMKTKKLKAPKEALKKIEVLPQMYENTFLLYNILSTEECQHLISECEKIGFEDCYGYDPSYRSNKRIIMRDPETANLIYKRIEKLLPKTYCYEEFNWEAYELNPTLRLCRYSPGQHFSPHYDGFYQADRDHRSFFTFMIYLNDGYGNGNTNFLTGRPGNAHRSKNKVLYQVVPTAGMALIFPHELLHEGEVLSSGVKYILRSDIMFLRKCKITK